MPSIRFMAWNIQNYGQNTVYAQLRKGVNSVLLNNFIAAIVQELDIDILGIMEVMPTAQPHLDNLLTALNSDPNLLAPDWVYDWIKGSVHVAPPPGNVNAPNTLSWRSGVTAPRQEGYALFWRNGLPSFSMIGAAQPMSEGIWFDVNGPPIAIANSLSLSLTGRPIQGRGGRSAPRAVHGFQIATVGANWDDAYFPDTARVLGNWAVYWEWARRPCYCIIEMPIPGATNRQKLCPIMLYHSPSYRSLSQSGTFIAGLSQELYAVHDLDGNNLPTGNLIYHDKVIAAGDYNVPTYGWMWDQSYQSFHGAFAANNTAGANCLSIANPNNYIKTTVQLNQHQNGQFNGPPIVSANIDDYYALPIDDLFWRGLTLNPAANPSTYVFTVPEAVMNQGELTGAPVQGYFPWLQSLRNVSLAQGWGVDPNFGPRLANGNPAFSFMTNWNSFYQDLQNGDFTTARSAAEFAREFVSDHLPLVIDFAVQ